MLQGLGASVVVLVCCRAQLYGCVSVCSCYDESAKA